MFRIIIFVLLGTCSQYILASTCPSSVTLSDTFSESLVTKGYWYEQYRTPSKYQEDDNGVPSKCVIFKYHGEYQNRFHRHYQQTYANGTTDIGTFNCLLTSPSIYVETGYGAEITYHVLAYEHRALMILYACIDDNPMIWFLTRDREATQAVLDRGLKVIQDNGFPIDKLFRSYSTEECNKFGWQW